MKQHIDGNHQNSKVENMSLFTKNLERDETEWITVKPKKKN